MNSNKDIFQKQSKSFFLLAVAASLMKDQQNLEDLQKTKIRNQSLQKERSLRQAVLRAKAVEVK